MHVAAQEKTPAERLEEIEARAKRILDADNEEDDGWVDEAIVLASQDVPWLVAELREAQKLCEMYVRPE